MKAVDEALTALRQIATEEAEIAKKDAALRRRKVIVLRRAKRAGASAKIMAEALGPDVKANAVRQMLYRAEHGD